MSNTKTVMGQAANTQGIPLDITDVFSTYLYTGTGAALTINNGIDLAGEGGLVWLKNRNTASNHSLHDTERTPSYQLVPNSTAAEDTLYGDLTSFNSDGFSLGTSGGGNNIANTSAIASWTFRKAPKFFDIVTYTGTGSTQTIAHNLGSVPGMVMVKRTDASTIWPVYHTGVNGGTNPENYILYINGTASQVDSTTYWNDTAPTDSVFTVGTNTNVNASGGTYVAYLFAHNDGDGEFGPDGDQDIIKCGSYTGNGSSTGPNVNLGFEPQWLLIKNASASSNWTLFDSMRGLGVPTLNTGYKDLNPNLTNAEAEGRALGVTATGFQIVDNHAEINGSGNKYIYIAIRRGPLAPPESATEVFAIDSESTTAPTPPSYNTGFAVDMFLSRRDVTTSGSWYLYDRLRKSDVGLIPNATNAELVSGGSYSTNDRNDGIGSYTGTVYSNKAYGYMWKRAPNYFDVVAYTGSGANTVINHNLDAIPEMVWVKNRGRSVNWNVYHKDLELNGDPASECRLFLNTDAAVSSGPVFWGTHTDTTFTMTVQNFQTNYLNDTYTAYLFASLPGISKVGSYTGNGTSQTIDCGFTSGARFVLVKCTTVGYDWQIFDTERGIVAGTDSKLALNTTQAEQTSGDFIDPSSSGFAVTSSSSMNANGETFIFYAIA